MADPGLLRLIRESPVPPALPPPTLPADLEALLFPPRAGGAFPFKGIHTVIFDVYGTLFSSAAGDISGAGDRAASNERLEALARELGCTAQELGDHFHREVQRLHGELGEKTPYPEVRVEEIWADFLNRCNGPAGGPAGDRAAGGLAGAEKLPLSARELALRYELAVNPVSPMPGAGETLKMLKARGIRLGLISNAQFFTPLLFEAFFGALPEKLGFDPDLLIYSYELGEAKPSPALFTPPVRCLESLGLDTRHALYIGNDMLNDVYAAARAGFTALLFAGDARSLRLREGHPLAGNTRPAAVIRNLGDIGGLLGF
ncbi:HAD family hydrolase [Treponema primitia]|uniref:HAD family hydrolase n=1 Tax=Treponema primitia TaxID=88058 RepID=UPI00069410A0|nr:HAD family hydrolase [Treponema primitia]